MIWVVLAEYFWKKELTTGPASFDSSFISSLKPTGTNMRIRLNVKHSVQLCVSLSIAPTALAPRISPEIIYNLVSALTLKNFDLWSFKCSFMWSQRWESVARTREESTSDDGLWLTSSFYCPVKTWSTAHAVCGESSWRNLLSEEVNQSFNFFTCFLWTVKILNITGKINFLTKDLCFSSRLCLLADKDS